MRQRLISGLLVAATLALPGAAVAGSKGRKNTAMVLTGVSTSQCVDLTARDAADRNYRCVVVEDAVSAHAFHS